MRRPDSSPLRTLLKNRRVGRVLAASATAVVVLVLALPMAYSLPSFTLGWDTPVSMLLGAVLGCVAAMATASVTPGLEASAVERTGVARCLVVVGCSLSQLAWLVGFSQVGRLLGIEIPLANLVLSTIFFQGVGVVAVVLTTGPLLWLLPLALASAFILFGYSPAGDVRGWNLLLVASPLTWFAALAAWGAGMVLVRRARPGVWERWTRRL